MQIINNDIWNYWKQGAYIVIPTNGFVKKTGELVMGRGLALQAKEYIHSIESILGGLIKEFGNIPFVIEEANIISFPVKHNWWEKADLKLIEISAVLLKKYKLTYPNIFPVYMPKVGCGNGQLNWKDVEPIIEEYLGNLVIIVDNETGDRK
jgi:hypothetical protein